MQPHKNIGEWKAIIEEQAHSGLSKSKFCQQKNINEAKFYYYQRLIAKTDRSAIGHQDQDDLIPVKIKESAIKSPHKEINIKIVMKNGMECILPLGLDNKRLREILGILMSC